MSESDERARFVAAALTWLGTPYHHHGKVKGVGCDCATLLVCAAQEAQLIPQDFDPGNYSPQWALNRTAQTYLATIGKVCVEVPPPPRSGDVIVWQFGRTFSHGAIVVEWPRVIHAYFGTCVQIEDAEKAQWLTLMGEANNRPRPFKLMSLWSR